MTSSVFPGELKLDELPIGPPDESARSGFQRIFGPDVGIEEQDNYSIHKLDESLGTYFRGIAAGDVHNDGRIDLVVTSDAGLSLYANQGDLRFARQQVALPGLERYYVANAALVDLDNDGWLDLFFSTYRHGTFVAYNRTGTFDAESMMELPNQDDAVLSAAPAFGDLDRDGDLDIVLGNWSIGLLSDNTELPSSSNVWLENRGDRFQQHPIGRIDGETLSTLLADVDGDGNLDLLVGNDFAPTDELLLGDGRGGFATAGADDSPLPFSTRSTMSITRADIDNDLEPELYFGQITENVDAERRDPVVICAELEGVPSFSDCVEQQETRDAIRSSLNRRRVAGCQDVEDPEARRGCMAVHLLWQNAVWAASPDGCLELARLELDHLAAACSIANQQTVDPRHPAEALPSVPGANLLLRRQAASGDYVEQAGDLGIDYSGWTWNADFGDLDNDGWQDLFVVNGFYLDNRKRSSALFHNLQGTGFEDRAEELGLASLLDNLSYSYVDLDNDGDLDIVAVPTVGPISVYRNDWATGNSIQIELRDQRGNRFGVGADVVIHYGANERQIRTIEASGGFASFDPLVAHFGLGPHDTVDRIEITWSTGEVDVIAGPHRSGARYRIHRG